MRGKVTYRYPQPPVDASPRLVVLLPATRAVLERELGLGRKLTPEQQRAAAKAIESVQFWRARDRVRTKAADCKATLMALAEESDELVLAALATCDVSTRALVNGAAKSADDLMHAAGVKSAAGAALANFPSKIRGRPPTPGRMLAASALSLWQYCGGTGAATVNTTLTYESPLVRFAAGLFDAAGETRSQSQIAKLLQEAARGN